jgi:hypothetical protein
MKKNTFNILLKLFFYNVNISYVRIIGNNPFILIFIRSTH